MGLELYSSKVLNPFSTFYELVYIFLDKIFTHDIHDNATECENVHKRCCRNCGCCAGIHNIFSGVMPTNADVTRQEGSSA